jgi:hypothetical protein
MTLLKVPEEGHYYQIQRSQEINEDLDEYVLSFSGPFRPHYNPDMVLL